MASFSVNVFKGIDSSKSPLVMDKENAIDISNLRIDNPAGALSSNLLGFEKWHSLGAGEAIQAIFQLQKHGYTSIEDTLFYLTKIGTTARWFIGKLIWYYINEYRTLGSYGSGDYQFTYLQDIKYNPSNQYIYGRDAGSLFRFKMDGTGFTRLSVPGGTGYFFAFAGNYVYTTYRISSSPYTVYLVKTGLDLSGDEYTATALSNSTYYGTGAVAYDSVNGKIVMAMTANAGGLYRCNLDGTTLEWYNWTAGHNRGIVGQIYFDPTTEYYYCCTGLAKNLVKTQWGNTGTLSVRTFNEPTAVTFEGVCKDPNSDYMYVSRQFIPGANSGIWKFRWDDANTLDTFYTRYGSASPALFNNNAVGQGPTGLDFYDDVIYIGNNGYRSPYDIQIIALWKDYLTA